jgi:hypothetical protein
MWEETVQLLILKLLHINLLCINVDGHRKSIAGYKEYTLWN